MEEVLTSAVGCEAQQEEHTGLTAASLKHVRRQRDKLSEEKTRLQAELVALQAQLKEQRDRVVALEAEAREAQAREAALREETRQALDAEHKQRERAIEAERRNSQLEESLVLREAEVARLKEALDEQRKLTKDVCEAAERRTDCSAEVAAFKEQVSKLQGENEALRRDRERQAAEHEELRRTVAGAMAAAERAMAMHGLHAQHMDQLRAAKLSEAINQKVELHISVPRVTLNYNNAPPLLISAASALNDAKIRAFLDTEVFPKFEPMWARMDSMDVAPDGSSKRAYSTKMLDKLTEAVKTFVKKSQQADEMASPRVGALGGLTPRVSGNGTTPSNLAPDTAAAAGPLAAKCASPAA